MSDEVETILEKTEQTLRMARMGYDQFIKADGPDRILGLRNAVTNGRQVTWVLQNLRDPLGEDFVEWYEPRQRILKDDEICSRMVEIRNHIVKRGDENVGRVTHVNAVIDSRQIPDWADGFVMGGEFGGNYFYIETPEGDEIKFYVDIPDEFVDTKFHFREGGGDGDLRSVPAEDELEYYLDVLELLVKDAKECFLPTENGE